jgi:hypothetical protein
LTHPTTIPPPRHVLVILNTSTASSRTSTNTSDCPKIEEEQRSCVYVNHLQRSPPTTSPTLKLQFTSRSFNLAHRAEWDDKNLISENCVIVNGIFHSTSSPGVITLFSDPDSLGEAGLCSAARQHHREFSTYQLASSPP